MEQNIETEKKKYYEFTSILNQWLKMKQQGYSMGKYLEKKGVKTIAIYGMSFLGERVIDELRDSDISILYGIDRRSDLILSSIQVYSPHDDLPQADMIIVTPVIGEKEIITELSEKIDAEIISIKELVYNL